LLSGQTTCDTETSADAFKRRYRGNSLDLPKQITARRRRLRTISPVVIQLRRARSLCAAISITDASIKVQAESPTEFFKVSFQGPCSAGNGFDPGKSCHLKFQVREFYAECMHQAKVDWLSTCGVILFLLFIIRPLNLHNYLINLFL